MNSVSKSTPTPSSNTPLAPVDTSAHRLFAVGMLVSGLLASVALSYVLVNVSPLLAVVAALAIPMGIVLVTRPDLALLLLIFTIPLESLNALGPGISTFKFLSILVFGGTAAHFMVHRRRARLAGAAQNWFILLFVIASIASLWVAIAPSTTMSGIMKLIRVLLLYFVAINVIRTPAELSRAMWAFFLGGMVATLYGMLDPSQEGARVAGTLGQANLFALSMVPRLPIGLGLYSIEKSPARKIFLLITTGIIAYGITLSGSRGGLLAAGIALLVFALTQRRKVFWITVTTVVAAISLTLMPLEMKQRVGLVEASSSQNLGNSTDRRETYQLFGFELWQQHPLLGVGLEGFGDAYGASEYRFLQTTQRKRPAHNTFLEVGVGTGLLGLLPFTATLVVSLYQMKQRLSDTSLRPDLRKLAITILAALGAYIFGMLFGSRQFEKTLWLLVALAAIVQQLSTLPSSRLAYQAVPARADLPPASAPISAD